MTHAPATPTTAAKNGVIIAHEEISDGAPDATRRRSYLMALAYYSAIELANLVTAHNARRASLRGIT